MQSREVRFTSGGERCAATLYSPSTSSEPSPCVVMGSGFSCVRDQGLASFGERFAAAGIAALAFDYRHYGDSEGEPRSLLSARRQRGDWRAALAFARSLEGVDAGRVAIWGYSLGGAHVQRLAATEPGIAAAICVAPVVNGPRTLNHMAGPLQLPRLSAAGLRDGLRALRGARPYRIPATGPPGSTAVLNSPGSVPGFAAITRPGSTWRNETCARFALAPPYLLATRARRIECPILFCLTEDDDVNPPALGKRAARRAPRGELRIYPGGHFDPFLGETFERMSADQVAFLRRRLGPPARA
jgi:dienelactone hydrolase